MEEEKECEDSLILDSFEMPGDLYEEVRVLSILQDLSVQELILKAVERYVKDTIN